MNRRAFLVATAGILAAPLAAGAPRKAEIPRIGLRTLAAEAQQPGRYTIAVFTLGQAAQSPSLLGVFS
jgi:hypothetical protein